ncbi:MAG: PQQ-binding-like beta-propeller repeat protein [Chromatiales bacterium]|nr:MAG: PQQ-binding-like beta-propeller repeat protein [Chromatiales bacterium]
MRARAIGRAVGDYGVTGLALWLLAGPAGADDTELFVTGYDAPASCTIPNVLFVIDTSGSMGGEIDTQASWDPLQEFSGCFDSNTLYYTATGDLPECDATQSFPKASNFCAAADDKLALVGRYRNLYRGWDADRLRWVPLEDFLPADGDPPPPPFPVECEMDRGIDGDGTSSAVYASDGTSQPWADTDATEPAWASASNVTIFDGNWLNWNTNPPTVTKSRLEIVQEVTNTVIDSMDDLNVGVMRFNQDEGGPVIQAMVDVDAEGDQVKSVINGLAPDGQTPLSETLYEAGQFLAGRLVDYGNVGPELSVAPSRVGGTITGTAYNSPMAVRGQKTYLILLSDGEPSADTSADGKITSLPGFAGLVGPSCDGTGDGACLDDMAEYLFKADLRATVGGQQNVITHTIGFTQDLDILESTATRGGGRYFRADDTASLTSALADLAESFEEDGGVFTAPLVPVDAFNRAQTLNDVFVSVFEPSNTVRWPGNLKKYALEAGMAGGELSLTLIDQNSQPAIDPNTGFFTDNSQSFWSDTVDGADPKAGGAASQLPAPGARQLFTNIAGGDLNAPGGQNRVAVDNAAITAAVLGAPAADRDAVIEWARGTDVLDEDQDGDTTDARQAMGDPLHSRPVSVLYGGTAANPDATVFVSTNEGYLHAVDADTGVELWSFIPARLLQRLYSLYTNNVSATRLYGLDGEITVTIEDSDGEPGVSGGERVILLFGMRRGGDAVFALDVTNRNRPVLLWEIDPGNAGFASLGQSWSTPLVTEVNVAGTLRRVALFGGGYDTGQDNRSFREDNAGNSVFMVDLLTGARIWSAGDGPEHDLQLDGMRFSIPAELRVLDVDGNGTSDRLYFADMGGQLWRIDLVNGNGAANLGEGGVLASLGAADLGGAPPDSEVRRFYAAPDVVPVIRDEGIYVALNVGSGYRAHPLDAVAEDQFFSVRDFAVFDVIDTNDYPPPLTVDDLADITNIGDPVLLPSDPGWRLRMVLGAGEKVLTPATTFANVTFFTSFTPAGAGNACVPAGGLNRLYAVSILDGSAQTNLDQPADDDFDPADRAIELAQGGIAPEPKIVIPPGSEGQPGLLVGTEFLSIVDRPEFVRTFWVEREGP